MACLGTLATGTLATAGLGFLAGLAGAGVCSAAQGACMMAC